MNMLLEQVNSAGKAFVEFGWPMLIQSSALIAILLLADLLLRKKVRAVFRYWIWMLVLVKLLLPTTLTSPMSVGNLVGDRLAVSPLNNTAVETGGEKAGLNENMKAVLLDEPISAQVDGKVVSLHVADVEQAAPVATVKSLVTVAPLTWQAVVFLVWVVAVLALGLLLIQRAVFVCGLVRQSAEANGLMNDTLRFCCRQMGVKGRINLRVSANATSPAVCGLFRPVILVPANLGSTLGAEHLRMVLLHELAHIKRGDLWVNLIQTLLQIVYFYNPLLWLANWIIRRLREQAMDEAVQVALGEKAGQYPETLLNVAKFAFERPALSLRLVGVVESKSALAGRIKRMLTRPIPKTAKLGVIGLLVIVLIGAVLLPMAKAAKTANTTPTISAAEFGGQQGDEQRKARLKRMFEQRAARDKQIYTEQELSDIEQIYLVANKDWDSSQAQENLEKLVARYENANRTGCAVLYLGQMSQGAQKERYLKRAIEKHGDCMYGDGVQVGAFSMYQLGLYYQENGKEEDARKLFREMRQKFPDAVDHKGQLLAGLIRGDAPAGQAEKSSVVAVKATIELSHDDGSSDGKQSIAGSGHAVKFETPGERYVLNSVKIYGSRYGSPQAPAEDFHIWICDENRNIIKEFAFPYALFDRGAEQWVSMDTRGTPLPRKFILYVGFDPHQTKGVYVHYDGSTRGNSFVGLPGGRSEPFDKGEWMIHAVVSQQQGAAQPRRTTRVTAADTNELAHDDGKKADMESIAGGGHAVRFRSPKDGGILKAVKIYGSRYGDYEPPAEDFHVWLCDPNFEMIKEFAYPYSNFKMRGLAKWVTLETEPTELPRDFILCVGFNPHQTKGVYVYYDGQASGESFIGLPGGKLEPFRRGDWMIRAVVSPERDTKEEKTAGGSVSPASAVQVLIDQAKAGDAVTIPNGVYGEPIEVTKALTLKGESRDGCIFEVTANKPAILIDTKGKGKAMLEGVTIKWQLETSDKTTEYPFAVAVKDTTAEIKGCRFEPLGNFQRSPVAVRAIGFSELTVSECRFEGFEYVVCYGEGTKGAMEDCLILDCGHQGVILYDDSDVKIAGNVITGSKFHGVRSTGGKLFMKDNLIIGNDNRGVYLGNKSATGTITNNVIIGNATGINGFAQSKVTIENNVIADSNYAGIAMESTCGLVIRDNILCGNERGWIMFDRGGRGDNTSYRNTFWQNKVDDEGFSKTADSILAAPVFVDASNGDFSLKAGPAGEHKQGLSEPEVFKVLWKRWKNRQDRNEPFGQS